MKISIWLQVDIRGYTKEQIEEIKEKINHGIIKDQTSADSWVKKNINQSRHNLGTSIDARDRRINGSNDSLDMGSSEGESFGESSY